MKALVVYESMFGNTKAIAQAICAGLSESMEVEVTTPDHAPKTVPADLSLLMLGGPTHAFSMSRPNTRQDAVEQGATDPTEGGLREWLADLPPRAGTATVATFDTRTSGARHLPGSASKSAARSARRHGFAHVQGGQSFYVEGVSGPLLNGEIERARDWAREIARTVSTSP